MSTKPVSSIEVAIRARLVIVRAGALLPEIAKLLSQKRVGLVVVCSANGAMIGIITKTNLILQLGICGQAACARSANELMTKDVISCRIVDRLAEVLSMMSSLGFGCIPVVDDNGNPIGVVNERDALRGLLADEIYEESLLRGYVTGTGYQ